MSRRSTDSSLIGIDRQQLLGVLATVLGAGAGAAWMFNASLARLDEAGSQGEQRRMLVLGAIERENDLQNARIAALEARRCDDR